MEIYQVTESWLGRDDYPISQPRVIVTTASFDRAMRVVREDGFTAYGEGSQGSNKRNTAGNRFSRHINKLILEDVG